jgi:hypothetical protein
MRDRILLTFFVALLLVFLTETFTRGINVSLFFSLFAAYIAMYGLRSNTSTMVSVIQCMTVKMTTLDENGGKPFYRFHIAIRNEGVKLIDPMLVLAYSFPPAGYRGTWIGDAPTTADTRFFERGMIFDVEVKSYLSLDRQLDELKDARKQRARLEIYSQKYRAYTLPIGGWKDRLNRLWNGVVGWLSMRSRVFRHIPTAIVLEDAVMALVQNCKREAEAEPRTQRGLGST